LSWLSVFNLRLDCFVQFGADLRRSAIISACVEKKQGFSAPFPLVSGQGKSPSIFNRSPCDTQGPVAAGSHVTAFVAYRPDLLFVRKIHYPDFLHLVLLVEMGGIFFEE